jgi:metallo-beta-lactamase class B
MQSKKWLGILGGLLVSSSVGIGLHAQAGTGGAPAAGPNTIAGHVAAGRALAGQTWLQMYSEMCGAAMPPQARGAAAEAGPAGPPTRDDWYQDPIKMFDNVWAFSTPAQLDPRTGERVHNVMAMAVVTSDGIILIDSTYDYSVKGLIVDAMPKIGLDPKQIKYAVITHGHGDHFAGAKYLQDTFGTKIIMGDPDWTNVARPAKPGGPVPTNIAKKDLATVEGQKLTLGDTTITLFNTPGHTVGTTSAIIPVKDKGVTHYAAMWGGTSISQNTPYEQLVAYNRSSRKMAEQSAKLGVDVILTPHGRVIDFPRRAGIQRAFPMGPNQFIAGQDAVRRWWAMIDHCSQAVAMAQQAAKKQ